MTRLLAGQCGVRFPAGNTDTSSQKIPPPVLEHIHPLVQWIVGFLSLQINWAGYKIDRSPLSSAKVKDEWS